jgi:lipopolysaccharide transport system ATP-binding protein
MKPPIPGIVVYSNLGVPIYGTNPRIHNIECAGEGSTSGTVRLKLRQFPLVSGHYTISVFLGDLQRDYDRRWDVLSFEFRSEVEDAPKLSPESIGYLNWPAEWRVL